MKGNYFIGIYTFWCLLFVLINESVFKSTLLHIEYFGFLFIVLNIAAILFKYNPKWFNKTNIIILLILLSSFLLLPQYTYKEAVAIVSNLDSSNTEIIDNTNESYRYKIGTPQIYIKGSDTFFITGDYLIYVLDKNSNAIIWYKVSPEDGTFTIFQRREV